MEKKIIVLRYSEIHLKGKNRGYFEKQLLTNIQEALNKFSCKVERSAGRYYVSDFSEDELEEITETLYHVFGLYSYSIAYQIETSIENIYSFAKTIKVEENTTFKVSVNRADKSLSLNSMELARNIGGIILKHNKNISVDLFNPQKEVCFDIREEGITNIYHESVRCAGGMPLRTAGKGLLLLSGGIDSPVAGYEIARRGMNLNAIHYHSYPYTSKEAKEKVITLANIIKNYVGMKKIYVVNFTKIQEEIHKNCDDSYMITIMRRIMLRIAERIAKRDNAKALITGESLGQVASQTIESITATNDVLKHIPVLRPLIANDKEDIIKIAKKIKTFQTSILPYEDCCTVFLPKFPVIKPRLDAVENEEKKLNIEELVSEAVRNIEIIKI